MISLAWNKIIWLYTLAISIHMENLFLSTATKQLHLNLISKLILRIALLLTKHNKGRWIPYPCKLTSPLSSSSKTLSKHMLSTPMFWFFFHSIRGALRAERFWNCKTERMSRTLTGYILNTRTTICFSCCHRKYIIYKPFSQINNTYVYEIKKRLS
jgi:hypothetical protein